MAERDKHAAPDKLVSKRVGQAERRSSRQAGYADEDGPLSQMQADNQRLRQAQLDAERERGIQRRPRSAAHRARGPEDETRNQPRRK